jgi:hypothetical protein
MTKKTIMMTLIMALLPLSFFCLDASAFEIELQVGYFDPNEDKPEDPRSPILIPQIEIENNVLYFNTPIDGDTLQLLDDNGVVVYTTVIPNGSTNLVLPSYLSGEYEIQIIQGNLCFYGYIIL